uniref:Vesicle-associated membrane protein-associated protein A n=1 Tax=Aceria tosichella TaxID=561515 RepID=A0A6G1SG24_9ACAR
MVATQKLPQILQLNPASEIVFLGPFDRVVTSYLELKNPSGERVCFKVKTTAPRRYCVRPNNGTIEPNGKIRIAIMLQPMDADSQTERSKHKFMVQSTIIKGDDNNTTTLDEIWQNATSDEIMDSKLRCVFQTPEEEDEDPQARQKLQDDNPALAGTTKSSPDISSTVAATITATKDTTSQQMESTQQQQQQQQQQGRQVNEPSITTSTPVVSRATSSTTKSWGSSSAPRDNKRSDPSEQKLADKSMASSHNLTSSFLQPLSDDYKIVLVSLAMLFLGVILGKYII